MSTLYLFAGAAEPVFDIARVIEGAQADGWDVCLGLTPTAARWLAGSLDGLAVLTGHPVRWDYELPGEPGAWPEASAVLVAPATFNTVNQWALGIVDEFVVGVAAEGIGKGIPMVAVPCLSAAYAQHPQFERSVETLRGVGVSVLYGEGEPEWGDAARFPWRSALDAVRERVVVG
ncbi:flavoprotein [Streptomyces sp. NRRL B-24572]|uniref:flavoprotein n=1 Tax=Streptomyces sp. NRRL B-24572 TaxID=1962156 RepID=UPI000A370F6A|nr:flavoprotein [Streptomyces sp. NRRL B-24572]